MTEGGTTLAGTTRSTPPAASVPVIARRRRRRGDLALALATGLAFVALGCRQDMHDQPKYEPLEASSFFADGMASRQLPAGTVARGHLAADTMFHTGKDAAGAAVAELPMPATQQLLRRGRERYDIFCSPCHGRLGDGRGMVARRGFKQPPSFHEDRLRNSPVGYYVDVMTNGFGVMPSYAVAIPAADRWAIAAYLRALQLSQRAHLTDLSSADRAALEAAAPPGGAPAAETHGHGAPSSPPTGSAVGASPSGATPAPSIDVGAGAPAAATPQVSPQVSPSGGGPQ